MVGERSPVLRRQVRGVLVNVEEQGEEIEGCQDTSGSCARNETRGEGGRGYEHRLTGA
jgi:hypothetical protein